MNILFKLKNKLRNLRKSFCWNICHTFILRDLFNAAFVSCWTELTEAQQDELIQNLEQALKSEEIPEITQTLLNLAEFMEHCDKVSYCFFQQRNNFVAEVG